MARYMRSDLGRGHTNLRPPAVVGSAVVADTRTPPSQGYLAPVDQVVKTVRQRGVTSHLRPPVVVGAAAGGAARPIHTTFAPQPRTRTMAGIRAPRFVGAGIVYRPVQTHLAPSFSRQPRETRSVLGPPVVAPVEVEVLAAPISTTFAPPPRTRTIAGIRAPRFIGAGIFYRPVQTHLAYSRRGTAKSRLFRLVQTVAATYQGPSVHLARNKPKPTTRFLRKPVVIDLRPQTRYLSLTLAPSRDVRHLPHSRLFPPAVVQPRELVFFGPATALAYSRRGRPKSRLRPPVVIDLRPQVYYPTVSLAYSRRGTPKSRLEPPAAVTAGVAFYTDKIRVQTVRRYTPPTHPRWIAPTVVFGAPGAFGWLATNLVRRHTPQFYSRLYPPTVVDDSGVDTRPPPLQVYLYPADQVARSISQRRTTAGIRPPRFVGVVVYPPVQANLAYSRRGATYYSLRVPVVVVEGRFGEVKTSLVRRYTPPVHSRLRPPVVVRLAVEIYGPTVRLVRRVTPPTLSTLRPPTVIDRRPQTYFLAVTLARTVARRGRTLLRPPVVVGVAAREFYGPRVELTYSRRGRARYGLAGPAVVLIPEPVLYPVAVALAYSLRGRAKSRLRPPVVVTPRAAVLHPIATALARTDRRYIETRSTYVYPIVIFEETLGGTGIQLVRRYTPPVTSRLSPPTVVTPEARAYFGPQVTLVRVRPAAVHSRLRPPTDTKGLEDQGRVHVSLAYSRRGRPKSILRKPVVIDLRPQVYYLSVTLARNKPQPTFTFLRPSMVTEALPKAERDLRITLAYSRRGKPKPFLRKPTVIDLRPQTRYLSVNLTYSRRGRPIWKLRPPTVVGPKQVYFGPQVTLSPSKRGQPTSFLRPPAVVRVAVEIYGPETSLAYSRRGVPKSRLEPPTVVFPFFARPTAINLTYSRRGRPVYRLRLPVVVRLAVEIYGPEVTLAYSRRGVPKPVLQPPTVVAPFFPRAVAVSLAYSLRGVPKSRLYAPTVVYPVFFAAPVATTFVRITPPPTIWRLFPPTVIGDFVPPAGDVCGDDEAASDDCGFDEAGSTVSGSVEAVQSVRGSDTPGSRITGSDAADGEVCGSDEQAT